MVTGTKLRRPPPVAKPKSDSGLKVVYRETGSLAPFERNARTHSPEQISQISNSIREFGFTNPILLMDDGRTIGAGHARQLAAVALGMKTVPTIVLPGLSKIQWRAYVIADNKMALNAGWDEDLLRMEIGELEGLDFDLALTGFNEEEIAKLLESSAPSEFQAYGEDIETEHTCPKCGFRWSGKADAGGSDVE